MSEQLAGGSPRSLSSCTRSPHVLHKVLLLISSLRCMFSLAQMWSQSVVMTSIVLYPFNTHESAA